MFAQLFSSSKQKNVLLLGELDTKEADDALATMQSIQTCMLSISFTLDGVIEHANENFCKAVDTTAQQLIGHHHSKLCEPSYAKSEDYRQFWRELNNGKYKSGLFPRVSMSGKKLWLEAHYFPVRDESGNVVKITKLAIDVTDKQEVNADKEALLSALNSSMASIKFSPDGTVLEANDLFLKTMGYSQSEIIGQHHKMFCFDEFYEQNPRFWEELANGKSFSDRFCRKTKHGDVCWLEATYQPVLDEVGRVYKVVKFASDISNQINRENKTQEAIQNTSQKTSEITEQANKHLSDSVDSFEKVSNAIESASNISHDLETQAKHIVAILNTMQKVAEQTNLLALNAAIEAARAGDVGRGFAVVADEVRQLAGQTAQSSTEIADVVKRNSELISQLRDQMQEANSVSAQSERNIAAVSSNIEQVDDSVNQLLGLLKQ